MALYLVIHSPRGDDSETVRAPSRLRELAQASSEVRWPRWLKTWSPDLRDDRIFSLWEGQNAAEVAATLHHYGYLDDRTAEFLRVNEWGPADVLAAEGESE
jgi:hypothetical protein